MNIEAQDEEYYRRRLEAKLQPERIRATLAFAGLYQMTHELIKQAVLSDVRQFYWKGITNGETVYDEVAYAKDASARARDKFRASLLWLIENGAVTRAAADRLDEIYAHRHELSHELIKYLVDPDFEPSLDLFAEAVSILRSIRRFWTGIEKDMGSFDEFGDVDLYDVTPATIALLELCIDSYTSGLPTSEQPGL